MKRNHQANAMSQISIIYSVFDRHVSLRARNSTRTPIASRPWIRGDMSRFAGWNHLETDQYASGIRRGRTREEAVPVEGTQCPQPAANSEAFSQEIVPIHQGSSFSPFLHRVVRISSRVACNRKASTLWRGGAL